MVETRYKPWGEVRFTTETKTLPTRYTFTGQYSHMSDEATDLGNTGFGLMFYNARWYDPALGRMAQADSIVPGGVQGLDRYAYANNSPVIYVDPSGHSQRRSDYREHIRQKRLFEIELERIQYILNQMEYGDIVTFTVGEVTFNWMLGLPDDGTDKGFWDLDTSQYIPWNVGVDIFSLSNRWTIYKRSDKANFDNYYVADHKGETFSFPNIPYYWTGGVDNNPSYVEIYTVVDMNRILLNYMAIEVPLALWGFAGANTESINLASLKARSVEDVFKIISLLVEFNSWGYFINGEYIIERIPIIHTCSNGGC